MQKRILLWMLACSVWGGALAWAEPPKETTRKVLPNDKSSKSLGLVEVRKSSPVVLTANTSLVKDGTPLAVIWSESPRRALRRFLRVRTLAPLEMLGPKAQQILAMVGAMPDGKPAKDLESFFVQLPALLDNLGLDLGQPFTSIVYAKSNRAETLISFGVDVRKLLGAFARWRLPVRVVRFAPDLALLLAPPGRPVALVWNGRLYAMFGPDPKSVMLDAAGLGRLLDRVWSKQGDGMAMAAATLPEVSCPDTVDICAKVSVGMLKTEQLNVPMGGAVLPLVKRYFRGIIGSVDMRDGIQAEQRFVMTKEFAPILGVLRSDTTLASWFSMLPISTGWFGRTHLSPDGIVRLIAFAENFHPRAKEMIASFRAQQSKADGTAKQMLGTDLTSVLKGLRGDFGGGFLWEDEMARVVKGFRSRPMTFFPGHLRGMFFALGFNSPSESKGFLRLLLQAWTTVLMRGPRGRGMPPVRVEKVSLFGREALSIHIHGIEPVYLSTVQRFLFFFGHRSTFEQFAAVWKGKAPSFAATDTAGVRTKRALELLGPILESGTTTKSAETTPQPTGLPPKEVPKVPNNGGGTPNQGASIVEKKPAVAAPTSLPVQAAVPRAPHALRDSFPGLFDYALMQTVSAMVVHPRVVRDLAEWFVPPMLKPFSRRVWSHMRLFGVYDQVDGTDYAYGWSLAFDEKPLVSDAFLGQRAVLPKLLDLPSAAKGEADLSAALIGTAIVGLPMIMMSGVGAAVAIPAYLRFTQRSKASEATVNIKAIALGATAWYNDEHLDKTGKPLPRQFPCAGKGWICAPKAMPCASGQALYTPNPAQWQDTCWTQLRFSLNKPHHYRYCYKSDEVGVKARFFIKVEGDLNCDGKRSSYGMFGTVNRVTGEVEKSRVMKRNPLE